MHCYFLQLIGANIIKAMQKAHEEYTVKAGAEKLTWE